MSDEAAAEADPDAAVERGADGLRGVDGLRGATGLRGAEVRDTAGFRGDGARGETAGGASVSDAGICGVSPSFDSGAFST